MSNQKGVVCNTSVSLVSTDFRATNMCEVIAIENPVINSIGLPILSGTKSSGVESLARAHELF